MPRSEGGTLGTTAWLNTCSRLAPVVVNASTGADIHVLDHLGKQAAEHADRMHRDRKCAGERAKPDRGDEDQRPDEIRHRAAK